MSLPTTENDARDEWLTRVREVASSLLPAASAWGRWNANLNYSDVEDIMANVVLWCSEKQASEIKSAGLDNLSRKEKELKAYLFTVYKYKACDWLREKQRRKEQLSDNEGAGQFEIADSEAESNILRNILLEELLGLMDDRTRFIFKHLQVGDRYQKIVPEYNKKFTANVKANQLRSLFSKAVSKLAKQITHGS